MTTTDRMKGESAPAYQAFQNYCWMGGDRTLRAVGEKLGKSETLMERWSSRWKWKTRSALYDNQQSNAHQTATEQAELEAARILVKRREEVRERAWIAAQKLIDKAMAMLEFPVGRHEETRSEDGREVTIIAHPGDWKFGDTARMLTAADALARLSCGMATGKQEITGAGDQPLIGPGPAIPTPMAVHVTYGPETKRAVAAFGPKPDGA